MSKMAVDFDQLRKAVDWSIRQLDTPRKNRIAAIRQYVGSHYSDNGTDKNVPTNFLELAVTIYTRQLAARAPRVTIATANRSLKPFAKNMEIALNQIPTEIDLGGTLRRSVVEALFAFSVVKVGIAASGSLILGVPYGEPYVDLVSIDDYFCDMSAKSRATMQFEGNDYWVPLEVAQALYEGSDKIDPDPHTVTNENGGDRAESVSTQTGADLFAERVWLRDVWIPHKGQLVTYGVVSKKLFRIVDWDGPDFGPYHVLGFSEVPGNLLPLPPVSLWLDLHDLGNTLFRKLGRQASSKKTVAAFQGGNDADVDALKKATDGEGIRYSGQKPDAITVGGIDAPTLAFWIQIRDLFSYFGGNLDALGGLAPTSETVGQDKLISDAASARIKAMADTTIDFAKGIFKALAWYDWTDPIRKRMIEKEVPGTGVSVKREWSAETRDGDFLDYNIDIDVYSMQDDSPTTKLQKIGMALERYVIPMLPVLQQQGGSVDVQKLLELVGDLGNIPELSDIVTFQEQNPELMQPPKGNGNPAMMPANTTRTYERVNRSGPSRQGKDHVMAQLLMGGNVQPADMANAGRRVG
jgi:hypothetical protein